LSKVIGVITARMTSTRLPGKVLKEIAGKTNFAHHVERMRCVTGLDGVFLATSRDPLNEALIREAEKLGCGWYAGAEQDVVERHVTLCEREGADAVIRVTCDCPLFDMESASRFVELFKDGDYDFIYVSNMAALYGTLSELISYKALAEVHKHYRGPAVSIYIRENMRLFKTLSVEINGDLCRPEYRLTVDEPADLDLVRHIYEALYHAKPLDLREVYTWLDDNPEIAGINKHVGIKGINVQAANLIETPLYSLVRAGSRYVILDKQKKPVEPMELIGRLAEYFPELKGRQIQ
jgi:spore coat polysaccharide biosynthesis protein SpsF